MVDNLLSDDVISVDACMSKVIRQLWNDKITTLNCCCGHGNVTPIIIVLPDQNIEDVFRSIEKVDSRAFGVAKWSKDKDRELIYYFEVHRAFSFKGNEWDTVKFINLKDCN